MFSKWLTENSSQPERSVKLTFSLLLIVLLLFASGCSILPKEDEEEVLPPINPPRLSKKPEYTVTTQTLETKVRGTGKLMAMKEEELFFTDDGKRLKDIYVQAGDRVTAGQLLAELDVSDLETQLRQKQLQSRQDELTMIELLRGSEDMTAEQLEKAKIDFELKREELLKLQEEIDRAKLVAPFSGTVVSVYAQRGDTVKAYDTVMIVADLSQLTVAATLSQDDLKKVAVGMEAMVDINGYPGGPLKGTVQQLPNPKKNDNQQNGGWPGETPEKDTIDNYLLVRLDPFPQGLNRGTPLGVSVIVQRKENAIVIPKAALRSYGGRNYVQVVESDGTKREVDVEIGQQTSTEVEIVKGLTPGQKVVGR